MCLKSGVEESGSHNEEKRQQTAGGEVRSDHKWLRRGVFYQDKNMLTENCPLVIRLLEMHVKR